MEDFDLVPSSEIPATPIKGRGATSNVDHRFSSDTRQSVADGWAPAETQPPKTRLLVENVKASSAGMTRPTNACLSGAVAGAGFETQIFAKPAARRTGLPATGAEQRHNGARPFTSQSVHHD
ncbi:hypothetical protein [Ferribacterium limneticum]|uniref:hypothetical protein n=1 Tax=Ferribacterium limneticum TaxID=76259 RepID=UPI001CF94175|nr:hypothetical protein [Ferribacterium limneticum]UCV29325.1 hypothetical protein KI617_04285 [Ferribacterium limneticum]UCV33244.1 hypothetical protein KI608_04285 [Ferribacterium limneticum]